MKNYSFIITGLLILSLVFNYRLYNDRTETISEVVVHDTLIRRYPAIYDTIHIDNPRKVFVHILDTVDITEDDSIYLIDAVTKHYKDSLYEAWVSGIDAQLDSIKVFNKTVTRTITKTVPEYKYVTAPSLTKKWGFGGFVGGMSSFDINHFNLQGGVEVNFKNLYLKGGYNYGRDSNYPFIGLEYKIR